jgi:hypothetical protein
MLSASGACNNLGKLIACFYLVIFFEKYSVVRFKVKERLKDSVLASLRNLSVHDIFFL